VTRSEQEVGPIHVPIHVPIHELQELKFRGYETTNRSRPTP